MNFEEQVLETVQSLTRRNKIKIFSRPKIVRELTALYGLSESLIKRDLSSALKNLVANHSLEKVKASYKLSENANVPQKEKRKIPSSEDEGVSGDHIYLIVTSAEFEDGDVRIDDFRSAYNDFSKAMKIFTTQTFGEIYDMRNEGMYTNYHKHLLFKARVLIPTVSYNYLYLIRVPLKN